MDHTRKRMYQAIAGYHQSTANRWLACIAASRIVGTNTPGATQSVAAALGLEVSQVENLARAGLFYRSFRKFGTVLQDARRALTVSHMVAFADAWRRYEMDPNELMSDLMQTIDSMPIPSVAALRSYLDGIYGETKPMAWIKQLKDVQGKLLEIVSGYQCPEDIRIMANHFLARLDVEAVRVITLEGERPDSWNTIWSGGHWGKRYEMARMWKSLVRAEIDPELPPMKIPVVIDIDAYFADHPQDSDNILAKPIVDGLKDWWIPDDTLDVVKSVQVRSHVDKDHPRIVIHITSLPGAKPWEMKDKDVVYKEMGE